LGKAEILRQKEGEEEGEEEAEEAER